MHRRAMSTLDQFSLYGRVVLVTGAGGGFGRAFAHGLASAGATLACLDLDEDAAAETASLLRAQGASAEAFKADVADEIALNSAVDRASRLFGKIDVLINNAGISTRPLRIHELPIQDWDRLMAVNLRGSFLCSKIVLPHMMKAQRGSIINVASITGMIGFYPGVSAIGAAYSASKAGLIGLTRQLAAEYATKNIRCNVIAPGFHEGTNLGAERRLHSSPEETQMLSQAILERTPLRRLGNPEELVGLMVYLASDASRFVTGQVIAHDGGWTAT